MTAKISGTIVTAIVTTIASGLLIGTCWLVNTVINVQKDQGVMHERISNQQHDITEKLEDITENLDTISDINNRLIALEAKFELK